MARKSNRGTEFSWMNRKSNKGTLHSGKSKKPPTLPKLKFMEKELEEEDNIPADRHKEKKENE